MGVFKPGRLLTSDAQVKNDVTLHDLMSHVRLDSDDE